MNMTDEELGKVFDEMAQLARRGDLRSVLLVVFTDTDRHQILDTTDVIRMIGELSVLRDQLSIRMIKRLEAAETAGG